ncbi:acyl transferase domain-containing protein, partial [Xylariaceae sp. FL0662B]
VIKTYLETEPAVYVACYNSPVSLTLSGQVPAPKRLRDRLRQDGHFARLLQVDIACHSKHISGIADNYHRLLHDRKIAPTSRGSDQVTMFSSVTGLPIAAGETTLAPDYWRQNMVSPVQFSQSAADMLSGKDNSEFLNEISPTSALAGLVAQVIKATPGARNAQYTSVAKRGPDTLLALYETAGKLWANAGVVALSKVKAYGQPSLVVDLPNYQWNHSRRYWHESISTNGYRQRAFIGHDLLGSKTLSVP